jgi:hypothetical protein
MGQSDQVIVVAAIRVRAFSATVMVIIITEY